MYVLIFSASVSLKKYIELKFMSLIFVIIGSIITILLAIPLLIFAGTSQGAFYGILFALPLSCLFSTGIVIYYYFHEGTSASYLWFGIPWLLCLITAIALPK